MRRRIRQNVNPKVMLVLAVVLIAVAIMVASKLDYAANSVMLSAPNAEQQPEIYSFWFNSVMVMFGLVLAIALGVVYESVTMTVTIIASTAILIIGSFEDIMYFLLGQGYLPANNVSWNWMFEFRLFGVWNTSLQIFWTVIWVGVILPVVVYIGLSHLKSY